MTANLTRALGTSWVLAGIAWAGALPVLIPHANGVPAFSPGLPQSGYPGVETEVVHTTPKGLRRLVAADTPVVVDTAIESQGAATPLGLALSAPPTQGSAFGATLGWRPVPLRGTLRGGGCAIDADCEDGNPCTSDTCTVNVCTYANVVAGTSCGSTLDDVCTDPDECDGDGLCLTNNAPNGTDCGGVDECLSGECGPWGAPWTSYGALLPQAGFLGSESRGGRTFGLSAIVVGRVIAGGGVDHAAVWDCDNTDPPSCTLALLPEGGAGRSLANAVTCDSSTTCLAGGSTSSPPQPAVWAYTAPNWTSETIPLPAGSTEGRVAFTSAGYLEPGTRLAAGETVNSSGLREATYWTRSAMAVWTDHVLNDFGPGRESTCGDLVLCPKGAGAFCNVDEILISGWAEDNFGVIQPVIWRETAVASGTFTMTLLPLPDGALGMAQEINPADGPDWFDLLVVDDSVTAVGTVLLNVTTTRGVAWATQDFSSWNTAVLSPVVPFENSTAVIAHRMQNVNWILGASYPAGGDPLLDGVATRWTVDAVELPLVLGPADLNNYFWHLPSGCTATGIGGHGVNPEPIFVLLPLGYPLTFGCTGSGQPHAGIVWVPPPPDNDDCVDRIIILQGSTAFNNVTAILDGPATTPACDTSTAQWGNDIWYEFVPSTSGDVLISLCEDTHFDAVLAFYSNGSSTCACPSDNTNLVDCADDNCGVPGGPSQLDITVEAGDCYLIRVGKWGTGGYAGTGTILISLDCAFDADCNDGNVCTDDTCVANTCQYGNNTLPCDDGLYCTGFDACSGGSCVNSGTPCSGALVCDEDNDQCTCLNNGQCDDGNVCTTDTCVAMVCQHDDNNNACNDGLFCTVSDFCACGACTGSSGPCSAGQTCDEALDLCVPGTSLVYEPGSWETPPGAPRLQTTVDFSPVGYRRAPGGCGFTHISSGVDALRGPLRGVYLHSGEFTEQAVDLWIPGRNSVVDPQDLAQLQRGSFVDDVMQGLLRPSGGGNSFVDPIMSGLLRPSGRENSFVDEPMGDLLRPFGQDIMSGMLRPSGRGNSFTQDVMGDLLRPSPWANGGSFAEGILEGLLRDAGGGSIVDGILTGILRPPPWANGGSFVDDIMSGMLRPSGRENSLGPHAAATCISVPTGPTPDSANGGQSVLVEAYLGGSGSGLDFVFARKYRSRVGPATAMGNGWDFSYNIYIEAAGPDIVVHDGWTRGDVYEAENLVSRGLQSARTLDSDGATKPRSNGVAESPREGRRIVATGGDPAQPGRNPWNDDENHDSAPAGAEAEVHGLRFASPVATVLGPSGADDARGTNGAAPDEAQRPRGRKPPVTDETKVKPQRGDRTSAIDAQHQFVESSARDSTSETDSQRETFAPPGLSDADAAQPGAYAPGYSPSPLTGLSDVKAVESPRGLKSAARNAREAGGSMRGGNPTWTKREFFRKLEQNGNGTYTLYFPDRGKWNFYPLDGSPIAGKIESIVDRNGNTMTFTYDAWGWLTTVTDALGRDVTITYHNGALDGFISSVCDFTGRCVTYDYYDGCEPGGSIGDLKSVTSPPVMGTPTGNDFPQGKTVFYEYTTGLTPAERNHNLTRITDPKGQVFLTNVYATTQDTGDVDFDHLTRQFWGTDGVDPIDVAYVPQTPGPGNGQATVKAIVNDRVGNVSEHFYDAGNRPVRLHEYTGRATPGMPTDDVANRPQNPLRPGEPAYFETQFEWNIDSLPTRVVSPNDNEVTAIYDTNHVDPLHRGDMTQHCALPGPLGGDQSQICESFEYYSPFGGAVSGPISGFYGDIVGSFAEVGPGPVCDIRPSGGGPRFVTKHTDPRGHDTIATYGMEGNLTQITHRIPTIVEEFRYNPFGQLTRYIAPDNGSGHRRVDKFVYYGPGDGAQNGYLKNVIIDALHDDQNDPPGTGSEFALTASYTYDGVGNRLTATDFKGNDVQFVRNALNQVVRVRSREVSAASCGERGEATEAGSDQDHEAALLVAAVNSRGRKPPVSDPTNQKPQRGDRSGEIGPENQYIETPPSNSRAVSASRQDSFAPPGLTNPGATQPGAYAPGYSLSPLPGLPNVNAAENPRGLKSAARGAVPGAARSIVRYETDLYYDANNNLVRIDVQNVDETGTVQANSQFTTVYEYDILNYPTRVCRESGSFTGAVPGTVNLPVCSGLPDAEFVTNEFQYDANRNRTLVVLGEASEGRQPQNLVAYTYDERDLLFQSTRGPGSGTASVSQYDYDGNGNLSLFTRGQNDQFGQPRLYAYEYDGYNRLTNAADPMGNVAEYHYDPNGNLGGFADAAETMQNPFAVRVSGELFDVDGSAGNVRLALTRFECDAFDRPTRLAVAFFDPETQANIGDGEAITTWVWTDSSQIESVTDDNLHATNYTYDSVGRLKVRTDAKANTVTYAYDDNCNMISVTELELSDLGNPSQSFTTTFGHDSLDRLTCRIDNVGNSHEYTHDSRDDLISILLPSIREIVHVYDGLSRRIRTARDMNANGANAGDPDDIVTEQAWDDNSRLTGQSDDNGHHTLYAYDALDRRIITQMADGTLHQVGTGAVWELGDSSPDVSGFNIGYDVHDNPRTVLDANGTLVQSTFDRNNRLVTSTVTPGAGVSNDTTMETYAYDGSGRLVSASDDDSVVTYQYDSLSNTTQEVQDGQTITSTFDGESNKLTCTYPSERTIHYTYDALNRISTIADGTGPIATYDYFGPDRVEQRTYNATDNDMFLEYQYDGVKRVVGTVHAPTGGGVARDNRTYAWDPNYNKTQRKDIRAAGPRLTHDYEYDAAYRLVHTHVTDAAMPNPNVIRDTAYDLDGVHNRLAISNIGSSDEDGVYDLDSTIPPADYQVNQYTVTPCDCREYDNNGNLTQITPRPFGDIRFPYCIIDVDEILASLDAFIDPESGPDADIYPCGGDGIIDSDDLLTMLGIFVGYCPCPGPCQETVEEDCILEPIVISYDYRNRMVAWDDLQLGLQHTYAYDASGRRIAKTIAGAVPPTTRYNYDGWQTIEEQDGMGTLRATYVYGNGIDEVLHMRRGALNHYYHEDDMGNVMAVSNAAGNAVERYEYDDFGRPSFFSAAGTPLEGSAIENSFLFNGREYDPEIGWYNYRTRYLDPMTGRFTTRDTIGTWGDLMNLGNSYTYVANNPWTFLDRIGRLTIRTPTKGDGTDEDEIPFPPRPSPTRPIFSLRPQ